MSDHKHEFEGLDDLSRRRVEKEIDAKLSGDLSEEIKFFNQIQESFCIQFPGRLRPAVSALGFSIGWLTDDLRCSDQEVDAIIAEIRTQSKRLLK